MNIRTLAEAQRALRPLAVSTVSVHTPEAFDLMYSYMAAIGNPEKRLQIVHIAGTSGKTSTAHYIGALLAATGKRVGVSISPYTYTLNDRLQLNGQPLSEHVFCEALEEFLERQKHTGIVLAYLPLLTAFAYWQLDRMKVDYAVIETNMGGRYDATNVARRSDKVAVITDIGLDHVAALGTSLPAIAAQKAGIMHEGNKSFMLKQSVEVTDVIAEAAHSQQADLTIIDTYPPEPVRTLLATIPLFQQRNWWLANKVYDYIAQRDDLPVQTLEDLERTMRTVIPGRMEHLSCRGVEVILDVAHNPQKMGLLVKSVQALYPSRPVAVMLMIGDGKDSPLMLEQLLLLRPFLISSEYEYIEGLPHQSRAAQVLMGEAQKLGFDHVTAVPDLTEAFQTLLQRPEPVKLVTGSLYGISQIKALVDTHL